MFHSPRSLLPTAVAEGFHLPVVRTAELDVWKYIKKEPLHDGGFPGGYVYALLEPTTVSRGRNTANIIDKLLIANEFTGESCILPLVMTLRSEFFYTRPISVRRYLPMPAYAACDGRILARVEKPDRTYSMAVFDVALDAAAKKCRIGQLIFRFPCTDHWTVNFPRNSASFVLLRSNRPHRVGRRHKYELHAIRHDCHTECVDEFKAVDSLPIIVRGDPVLMKYDPQSLLVRNWRTKREKKFQGVAIRDYYDFIPLNESCKRVLFMCKRNLTTSIVLAHLEFYTETWALQEVAFVTHQPNPQFKIPSYAIYGHHDGILTLACTTNAQSFRPQHLRFHRLPIGKPEKLFALCVFQAHNSAMPLPKIGRLRSMPSGKDS